jgi:1-acyl-sn-glycerol-3-phosphate acyltransferase
VRTAVSDIRLGTSGSTGGLIRLVRQGRFAATLVLGLAVLLPLRAVELIVCGRAPSRVASLFHRVLLNGLRIQVEVDGTVARDGLIVANHISWTDILVLGAAVPAVFVAKAEVRGWPLLGWLARLNPTLFVRRDARAAISVQVAEVAAALDRGPVTLFPEGTTGDGSDVLPFRPGLFAAAEGHRVQPVAITYRPAGRPWRSGELAEFAWDGDKDFWPHLLEVAGGPPRHCRIVALSPIGAGRNDRKVLAASCRALIRGRLGSVTHRSGT